MQTSITYPVYLVKRTAELALVSRWPTRVWFRLVARPGSPCSRLVAWSVASLASRLIWQLHPDHSYLTMDSDRKDEAPFFHLI